MSKQFLLKDLIPGGTSLGNRIQGLLSAQGQTRTDFLTRHTEIQAAPFPPTSRESTSAYAHYPYPPIRDPHWPLSSVGFYSAGYIAALGNENLKFNLPIALALVYLLDAQIIAEVGLVVRIPALCPAIGYDFGRHLISRVPRVKAIVFDKNERQVVQEELATYPLNFVLSQNLGASLHLHAAFSLFAEDITLENKRVAFVSRVCQKHFSIFRVKVLSATWEYHLFNLEEVHHEQENRGLRIVCCNVRALFRLLHRISVF
jgi:hypothetical protein